MKSKYKYFEIQKWVIHRILSYKSGFRWPHGSLIEKRREEDDQTCYNSGSKAIQRTVHYGRLRTPIESRMSPRLANKSQTIDEFLMVPEQNQKAIFKIFQAYKIFKLQKWI